MNDIGARILGACDRHTLAGQRDYVILCLLIENGLKRQQVAAINISDFDAIASSLSIQKRYNRQDRLNQKEIISLSLNAAKALHEWIESVHIPEFDSQQMDLPETPLFISLDRASYGHRLTGTAIYGIVKRAAVNAEIYEAIAPEQLRFSLEPEANVQLDNKCDKPQIGITEASETQLSTIPRNISHPLAEFGTEVRSNLLTALLNDKRSLNTRRAYEKDLHYFFYNVYGQAPSSAVVTQFLQLNRFDAIAIVLGYKSDLIAKGLKEATINRRLSALKSLVNFAAKLGKCNWNLDDVQTEVVHSYRDTTGINPDGIRNMLLQIDRNTTKGKRDFAILRLLWDNALRRNEVVSANIGDFDYEGRSLQILGKGRGSQKTIISLNIGTANAIQNWLSQIDGKDPSQPLFIALDPANRGHRLTGTAVYQIVDQIAIAAQISKQMSPHRIRHSAITAALESTNGNVRKVQKLSRHKKLDTLMLYDDNRTNMQGEVSNLLGELL